MTNDLWRWADPDGQQRSVRLDELRAALASGIIAPNTLVWRRGWKAWQAANEVPELSTSALSAQNGLVPNIPPPPLEVVSAQQAFESASGPAASLPAEEPPLPPRYVPVAPKSGPLADAASKAAPIKGAAAPTAIFASPSAPGETRKTSQPKIEIPVAKPASPTMVMGSPASQPATQRGLQPPVPSGPRSAGPNSRPPPPLPSRAEGLPPPAAASPGKASASLPTAVGLPPSPELAALAAAKVKGPGAAPPNSRPGGPPSKPPVPSKPAKPPVDPMIEELSGSILLDEPKKPTALPAPRAEHLSSSSLVDDSVPNLMVATPTEPTDVAETAAVAGTAPGLGPAPAIPESKGASVDPLGLTAGATPRAPETDAATHAAPAAGSNTAFGATQAAPVGAKNHTLAFGATALAPVGAKNDTLAFGATALAPETAEKVHSAPIGEPGVSPHAATAFTAEAAAPIATPPPEAAQKSSSVHPLPLAEGDAPLDESYGLPRRVAPLELVVADFRAVAKGQPPKNKVLTGAVAVAGLCTVILLGGLVVGAVRGNPSELPPSEATASATAPAASSAPPASIASAAPSAEPAEVIPATQKTPAAPAFGSCSVSGGSKVVAPLAAVGSGISFAEAPAGFALGVATSGRDASVLTLAPGSLKVLSTTHAKAAGGDARRVSPILTGGKVGAAVDVDRKDDPIAGRRTVGTQPPVDIGVAEGAIVWAPHGRDGFKKLFTLDGDGAVEALRGTSLPGGGLALTFRRAGAIYVGAATGESFTPSAELSRIQGLGQVGSPAITTSGDAVVVAWSDRASADAPWQIRWAKGSAAQAPSKANAFELPAGGMGTQAMSPSLAGLGGGSILLAWTEGPVSNHQVRALTLDEQGAAVGEPLAISESGLNAGQPEVGVGVDGRGVVAFLSSKAKTFELLATTIRCASK